MTTSFFRHPLLAAFLAAGLSQVSNAALPPALDICMNGHPETSMGPYAARELNASQASQLQSALDTPPHVVRLAAGNYRNGGPSRITLRTGYQLYGEPGGNRTVVPNITIEPGAQDIVLSGITAYGPGNNNDIINSLSDGMEGIVFPRSSAVTKNNCITQIAETDIVVNNAALENNVFLNLMTASVLVDNRAGGYMRNNRFYKVRAHDNFPAIDMRGDPSGARPSHGNVFLWTNFMTIQGKISEFHHQEDVSIVGVDAEGWNMPDGTTKRPAFRMGPGGTMRLFATNGGDTGGAGQDPIYDIESNNFLLYSAQLASGHAPQLTYRTGNKRSAVVNADALSVSDQASGARRLRAFESGGNGGFVNGTDLASAVPSAADQAELRTLFVEPSSRQGIPWERPTFRPIPNPAGANWASDRTNAPDDTALIQNMINQNGVARLEARTYYIGSSLKLKNGQGLIGAGMGRTAIVAKNAGINMIISDDHLSTTKAEATRFRLADLTLQGGKNGIYLDAAGAGPSAQFNDVFLSHVTFRDFAEAGFYFVGICGVDNNLFAHLNFYNSQWAFRHDGGHSNIPEPGQSYMDKTFFFHNQIVDTQKGFVLNANRVDNGNAWVNCLFQNNRDNAIWMNANLAPMILNSDFVNNGGAPSIYNESYRRRITMMNNYFRNDGRAASLLRHEALCEGCVFEGTGQVVENGATAFFINTRSNIPMGGLSNGLIINSEFTQNASLSGQGVFVQNGTARRFLDGTPNPVPQVMFSVGAAAPGPDTTPPVITNARAVNVMDTGATIAWTTNETADSQVEYGPTTSYGSSTPLDGGLVFDHGLSLSGLAAGALYNYRVKSKDAAGNLTTSANLTFRTLTPLPAPWRHQDIGATAASGNASVSNGVFTVTGSGADIYDVADAFHFVYQTLGGDGEIVARVDAVQAVDPWTKAGVMLREDLTAGSRNAAMFLSQANGAPFQWRLEPNTLSASQWQNLPPPRYVRVARAGNLFTGAVSVDGATWVTIGSMTVAMGPTLYAGLAVTAHNDGAIGTGTFSNVQLTDRGLPLISGVTVEAFSSSATVRWTTNEPADRQVDFGPTPALGTASPLSAALATDHAVVLTGLQPGAAVYFQAKSKDAAGNAAVSSGDFFLTRAPAGPCATSGTGLCGTYFNNTALSGAPAATRVDPAVNFDYGAGSPMPGTIDPDFSVRWDGYVTPPASGNYIFYALTDDGTRLWVNGVLVIDNWVAQAPTEAASAPLALTAGQRVALRLDYFEGGGPGSAKLLWRTPSDPSHVAVPPSALTYGAPLAGVAAPRGLRRRASP